MRWLSSGPQLGPAACARRAQLACGPDRDGMGGENAAARLRANEGPEAQRWQVTRTDRGAQRARQTGGVGLVSRPRSRASARHPRAVWCPGRGLGGYRRGVPFGRTKAMTITLRINGTEHRLDVDPEMPLLWVLRDVLNLTGTKYGCGEALCGACSVHLNGQVIRSCVTPVRRADGATVVTIEGLSPDGSHPLQKAWVELGVPQCGFCQAGQLMTAAALLKKYPRPTDEQIDQSMAGNLCRCGTYPRIRAAIKKVAGELP